MRIAHFSDLHLCSNFKKSNRNKIKEVLDHALENGAQHFVFTGDITDNAEEREFVYFRELLQSYNLLSSDKSTVIIGNHDIFGGPQTAQDVANFPFKCLNINYQERVSKFVSYFRELFENTIHPHEEIYFPFAKELKSVVLVGLNSIDEYSPFKNPFASNGKIGKIQRRIVENLLLLPKFKDKLKIVLVHHHFYHKSDISKSSESSLWSKIESFTMKLRGKKKLINLFEANDVSIVLHGHSHEMCEYFRKKIRFVNAGASMEGNEPSYFLIDAFPFDVSVSLQKFSVAKEKFAEAEIASIAV
ncbi:MAG: metallophosphoesterase [Ignavibacteria bacterium]|nr:MAG: metallophosphoesterase [Ignavibacteria bacterium]KAF0160894.1 MAG: metallophosphoesterase [Ignavibacteria bacterium]